MNKTIFKLFQIMLSTMFCRIICGISPNASIPSSVAEFENAFLLRKGVTQNCAGRAFSYTLPFAIREIFSTIEGTPQYVNIELKHLSVYSVKTF